MGQASQQLPSWLTLSSTLVTEPDGSLSTSFATLRLPLTYFGPSIPLGTDGIWTYGGLTPPPSTTTGNPTATPPPTSTPSASTTSPFTSNPTSTSPPSSGISGTAPTSSGLPATSSSSSTTAPGALANGHGLSTAVLGAILGSILGVLLLIVVILTLLLLRRNRRRSRASAGDGDTGTSSFWNRQTTLFTFRRSDSRRQTPIWTGWEFVEPDGSEGSRRSRNGGRETQTGQHTPGEGSPRGSGEEEDPFLTRRSIRSATLADETQTKSDTLVSVPAAAVLGAGTPRTSPRGGYIVPRDVLARTMAEHETSSYDIRVVEPSPAQDHSPLLPPPPLDPDGLAAFGMRSSSRTALDRPLAGEKVQGQSIRSEKSKSSLETDPAELLVARRVRVGDLTPSHSRLATIDSVGEPSTSRSSLGLSGLGARLGRLSWFRRMSTSAPPATPEPSQEATADAYTRTPPRTSRHGSHSRLDSATRLLDDADIEGSVPTTPVPTRAPRNDSGVGLGLLTMGSRPMSSVSARSGVSTAANTVYHSARSRPASSYVEFPEPVTSPELQQRLAQSPPGDNAAFDGPPPAYAERNVPQPRADRPPSEIDILDIPAPPPVTPFVSGRPAFPPGLIALPQPRTWRDSYGTDASSPTDSSGVGIAIDVLDDEPPTAQEGWRDLASERDGRRRTFGVPTVVEQAEPADSQYPSVHSLPSQAHLRPQESSNSNSAPSSYHSQGGSASSRPSVGSHLREVSSAHSLGTSSDESRNEVGVLRSPPLSAVMGSFGSMQQASRLTSMGPRAMPPPSYVTPTSSRAPLLGGTVTSATSTNTNTNSSVTTALTDPITGAVMHFPSLPWSRGTEHPTIRRVESQGFDQEGHSGEDHW